MSGPATDERPADETVDAAGPSGHRGGFLVDTVTWAVVVGAGAVMATQLLGVDGYRHIAAAQALTPYLPWLLAPVAVVSLVRRRAAAAASASAIGIAVLLLALPLVVPDRTSADPDAIGLRIASVNLLYSNARTPDVADDLARRGADVIVFTELTQSHLRGLESHAIADSFPHRVDAPGALATGIGVWSRHPVTTLQPPSMANNALDVTIEGPDGPVRILAVHPPTPIYDFDGWRDDLDTIGSWIDDTSAADPGTSPRAMVVGDFNASYWHPRYRELLDGGFRDAHIADGAGWSASWPTDVAVPPYVRLDHAIVGPGLATVDVDDFRVPGSDHAGFVVTVAPARRTTP